MFERASKIRVNCGEYDQEFFFAKFFESQGYKQCGEPLLGIYPKQRALRFKKEKN
ncbi:hypothetical protein AGMMS50276_25890 [Synergistales bacterium]|nr:hypothetical protein AGMMS50276_25890 [Synergistales bacterium]